jgi:hypothetical protein
MGEGATGGRYFNLAAILPKLIFIYFGVFGWLPPDVYSQRTAMNDPSSDGVKVVKPRRSRKEKKQCQGTSPKVRLDRLKQTIKDLTFHQEVLQLNYNNQTTELKKVLAERDSARTQLKISEKTSAQRLTLIQREVPNFVRGVLKGNFDCYRANL